jgi:hypothetical protein
MARLKLLAVFAVGGLLALPAAGWADGSIAFDRDSGATGISYNFRGSRRADDRALSECRGNCRIVGRYERQCAAIAVGRGRGYGWAARQSERRAQSEAIEACERNGDRGCRVLSSGCDE